MKINIKSPIKRIFTLFCIIALVLTICISCSEENNFDPHADGVPEDFKTHETIENTDYSITFYYGPDADGFNTEDIKLMKDAGFDIVPVDRFPDDYQKIKEVVKRLGEQGLNAAVCDKRITDLYNSKESFSQEDIDAKVKEVIEFYADCNNIEEWIICDEPSAEKFDVIAQITDAIHRLSPEDKAFVNLFPSYTSKYYLGTETYEDYLKTYCEKVKPDYLSIDYYDLMGEDVTESHRGGFVKNLATVTEVAKEFDIETRVRVLLTQHDTYSNVTKAEINWQSNLSVLFGMKSLSFFSYALPDDPAYVWQNAMLDGSGVPTDHYNEVKSANQITRVYGDALYNTKVDKVFSIDNTYTSEFINSLPTYSSYGDLGEVEAGIDMLVSFYDNGCFMVMNGNSDIGNPRKLVTKDLTDNLQWLNTYTRRWETFHSCFFIEQKENGTYEITLAEGNAVLLRVAKQAQ